MKRSGRACAHAFTCLLGAAMASGCGGVEGRPTADASADAPRVRTLTLGAYTTPREVYGQRILPAFREHWLERTGEDVRFEESYLGSGAQARAIAGGFEADVAALSLEPDIGRLVDAGLMAGDPSTSGTGAIVSRSIVVIGVRPGNPLGIHDWRDLARADVSVLTPSPRTSGGAMWNVAALYGAALRGGAGAPAGDTAGAEAFVSAVLSRVAVMDKGARESMITFEHGVGDAIITYENEVIVARRAGERMDYVIPRSTLLIENPAVVADEYAERHGNGELAAAFVAFLGSSEVQRMFAEYGFRSTGDDDAAAASGLPPVTDLFTIRDLGGWPAVIETLFATGAAFDRASRRTARAH